MKSIDGKTKKVGLGKGLSPLIGRKDLVGEGLELSSTRPITHPDWISIDGALNKFTNKIADFYQQQHPCSKVQTAGSGGNENVDFLCSTVLSIYFRVQASGAGWPTDTLVISNIREVIYTNNKDPLLELLIFLISIQKEIGYFYIGLEPTFGKHEWELVQRFPFKEQDQQRWVISIEALKESIKAEMAGS